MKTGNFLIGSVFGLLMISCGQEPVADFTWEPKEPKAGQEVKFTNLSTDAKSYSWNFGDMSIGDETNPTHIYERNGNYIVDLRAHNGLKSDEKTITINVLDNCYQKFIIAGDSINTCFEIIDICPDTVVTPYSKKKSTEAAGWGYCELDINGDYVNDLKFGTYFNVSAGGWIGDYGSGISTINNQIAYAVDLDSKYVRFFSVMDTINNKADWDYIPEIKIAITSFGICPPICPEYKISTNNNIINGFIGIRTIADSDTNYFYVNLDVVSSNKLVLKSIGRQLKN